MDNLYLLHIDRVGKKSDGNTEFIFMFGKSVEGFWGDGGYDIAPASICELIPDYEMITDKFKVETDIPLILGQEQTSFSMQDCLDNIVSICWEDICDYEEYPVPRIVIQFGDTYESVHKMLSLRKIEMKSYL